MSCLRIGPVYRFRGIEYRTAGGLRRALFDDSGALTLSSIGAERITASTGDKVLAVYSVSSPKRGEEIIIQRTAQS